MPDGQPLGTAPIINGDSDGINHHALETSHSARVPSELDTIVAFLKDDDRPSFHSVSPGRYIVTSHFLQRLS